MLRMYIISQIDRIPYTIGIDFNLCDIKPHRLELVEPCSIRFKIYFLIEIETYEF